MDALRLAQDLFFIPLGPGPNLGFDRAIVTGILSKGRVKKPVMAFSCQYLDGSRGEAYGIDGDPTQGRIKHLAFDRFEGRMMMERIFGLADALDAFLAWSDVWNNEPNACVTREERLALVGADAKKALTFAVARDASHLNQLITGNTFEENGW